MWAADCAGALHGRVFITVQRPSFLSLGKKLVMELLPSVSISVHGFFFQRKRVKGHPLNKHEQGLDTTFIFLKVEAVTEYWQDRIEAIRKSEVFIVTALVLCKFPDIWCKSGEVGLTNDENKCISVPFLLLLHINLQIEHLTFCGLKWKKKRTDHIVNTLYISLKPEPAFMCMLGLEPGPCLCETQWICFVHCTYNKDRHVHVRS